MKPALFILPVFLSAAVFFPAAAEDIFIPEETCRALSRLAGFDSLFRPTGKRAVAGVWLECAPKSVALKERLSDEMENGSLKDRFTYHPVNADRLMSDTAPDSAQMLSGSVSF